MLLDKCVILVLVHIASHFEMKSLVCTYFRRLRMCGLIDAYVYLLIFLFQKA
jgi:hypothetical protein